MDKKQHVVLSEDIYPEDWTCELDAYNDLAVYAYDFLERLALKRPIPEELIGDIVISACNRAYKYADRFDPECGKLHHWFNAILKHQAIDFCKKNLKNPQANSTPIEVRAQSGKEIPMEDPCPEDGMIRKQVEAIRKEVADALNDHIDNLRPIDKDIFIQAFVEDVPYRIIAEKTGLTETAARKRAFDIKRRIQKHIAAITPWKPCEMVLFNLAKDNVHMPIRHYTEVERMLLRMFPQYDKREVDIYEDHEMLKEQELHHMIATHLEICFDEEFKSEDEAYDGDLYESLYNELEKRGYGLIRHKEAGREHFIIMDDLDLIVEKRASRTVLHIGFTFEFIDIFAGHTPASKVADYIGSLHQLLDEIGDEIDGIL